MEKLILIPDSFKGTITAGEYCNIFTAVLKKHFPDSEIVSLPLADGGEGTTDCFLQMDEYKKVTTIAMNAFMEEKEVYYAVKDDVAVMEMAMCASLPSAKGRENPSTTTTYGVGQLIRHAVENGAKKIILGLGGSCTNDAGAGMAAADPLAAAQSKPRSKHGKLPTQAAAKPTAPEQRALTPKPYANGGKNKTQGFGPGLISCYKLFDILELV